MSSGSATVVTDAQTMKRKAEETVETGARTKKRQTAGVARIPVPQVHVGRSSGSGGHGDTVSPTPTEQRVVVPPDVPRDKRSSIEDMEIGQLTVKTSMIDQRQCRIPLQRQASRSERRFD